MFSFSSFLTSRRGSVDMTWTIIIGIVLMLIILAVLFPTIFNVVKPFSNFQDDCSNYGGVLLNASQSNCNAKVSTESTIVDIKKGYICCVKKTGVPQEYFDDWKKDEDIINPSQITSTGDSSQSTSSSTSTTYDPNNPVSTSTNPSNDLLPGSILGRFYSRQRDNEHFCFLGVQAYTNPDQTSFSLSEVTVNLDWGQNQAGCYYEENIIGSYDVNLTQFTSFPAPDDSHKVPCVSFTLNDQKLNKIINNIEDDLPVTCDKFYIGEEQEVLDKYFFIGTTRCDLFTEKQCLEYIDRPKNTWFSLNCHVVKPFLSSPKCTSCSKVYSCEDYSLEESCKSNQCLIAGDFAYEDKDCFWMPKNKEKPEKRGTCFTCEACGNYEDQETCHGSRDSCDTNCVWSTTKEVCELS